MSAQLIYAHQGCTWAMFPTSWHRCWNDNPTCLCAFPQRPALSQHMASVECGDATVELCMDAKLMHSWSTAVVFLILYSAGGMWSFGTACMCSLARTFSHTHVHDSRCVCVHSHMYLYVALLKPGLSILCLFF